jgi:hypothetical protein
MVICDTSYIKMPTSKTIAYQRPCDTRLYQLCPDRRGEVGIASPQCIVTLWHVKWSLVPLQISD